jgi:cysteine synthase A
VIVIPETQSQEKKDALRLLGAELIEVPAVPYKNPNNYVKISGRLAENWPRPSRTARSGPTSSTMSPTARPYRDHGPGNLAADRRQGGRLRLRRRHGRHAGRRRHRLRNAIQDVQIGLADPEGAALYSAITPPAS